MGIRNWLVGNFEKESVEDIADYGCSGGVAGLIYTRDINRFYDDYQDEIWEKLGEMADSFGHKNVLELISNFNGAGDIYDHDTLVGLLVWAVVEEFAREIMEDEEHWPEEWHGDEDDEDDDEN